MLNLQISATLAAFLFAVGCGVGALLLLTLNRRCGGLLPPNAAHLLDPIARMGA